jgi:hypothetical protein
MPWGVSVCGDGQHHNFDRQETVGILGLRPSMDLFRGRLVLDGHRVICGLCGWRWKKLCLPLVFARGKFWKLGIAWLGMERHCNTHAIQMEDL